MEQHIAIVGMACRFPGARNIDEFWENLRRGVESVTFFSREELLAEGISETLLKDPQYVRANAILDDIDRFDADFFGLTPREAQITDPQHRLFLECAWESLEHAGYYPEGYAGKIGVYAGAGMSSYLLSNLIPNAHLLESVNHFQLLMGNDKDYAPTRTSYKLNLKGPSVNINTACSTSLVAVHFACQGLLDYHCDMALAGGVGIQVPQRAGYLYQEGGILSPDGHCRAFDANAGGTVNGSGVGIVTLKRLEDAIQDGDSIYAVIKGSAVNNDGSEKVGYTAPSVDGQTQVIMEAQALAEIEPETVSYIETHGTGTVLGDPIEIAALTQAFRSQTDKTGFCAIGSVKTNFGHLDAAAGVAGLIKTVLALQHKMIPPSLHFERPNPKINFAESPFYVNTTLAEWQTDGIPRRAGVSSFGIGGTNAHVVLEEAPPPPPPPPQRGGEFHPSPLGRGWGQSQLLLLSAKTDSALNTAANNLAQLMKRHPDLNLADAAYTLQVGRKAFPHRRVALCRNVDDTAQALETAGAPNVFSGLYEGGERPVAFMFSGQGAQYINMGKELYDLYPTFRESLDHCHHLLRDTLEIPLLQILYPQFFPNPHQKSLDHSMIIHDTAYTQPALFALEYAQAQLWMSWGVKPAAMIGHSIGEYVAACLSGVFSLEDALALVAERGKIMQQLPPGSMLAVALPEEKLLPFLGCDLSLAAVNAPSRCVVSGPSDAVEALKRRLEHQGIQGIPLHTSHAFHSAMMDPALERFAQRVRQVALHPPQIPYISNVSGDWITTAEAADPAYWARHLRQTVRFSDGLRRMLQNPAYILLEIGPGRTLANFARQHPEKKASHVIAHSLPAPKDEQASDECLLTNVGKLWLAGVPIAWTALHASEQRRRLPLPTYPFERQRHWIDPVQPDIERSREKNPEIADWFYIPSWKRSMPPELVQTPNTSSWLVFLDECGVGMNLAQSLNDDGHDVVTVAVGSAFAASGAGRYILSPGQSGDYRLLFEDLRRCQKIPQHILHLWSVTQPMVTEPNFRELQSAQELGFYSLLYLVQALDAQDCTDGLRITVISNNVQEVSGEERLRPEKATLLGLIKVIRQEYPAIRCQSIDIALPEPGTWQEERLMTQLRVEMLANSSDPEIAYRGNHRWMQTFEACCLEDAAAPRLKKGATYLITGGLGGIGLILASYLAQSWQANLVLVSRSGLPPKSQWPRLLSAGAPQTTLSPQGVTLNLLQEIPSLVQQEEQIRRELAFKGLEWYEGLEQCINALCASYAYEYFRTSAMKSEKGQTWDQEELLERLGILPQFKKLYACLLNMLCEDGIIALHDGKIEFLKGPQEIPSSSQLRRAAEQRYPEVLGIFQLLDHCVQHYPRALRGEIEAISVLYPEGRSDLLEETGKNIGSYHKREIYNLLLQKIVLKILDTSPEKTVRILEIGVGDGLLARHIAPVAADRNVEYYVTDLGKSFVMKAEKQAKEAGLSGCMTFGVLDISKDPAAQGYEPESFDIIIGLDVVHATRRIADALDHLKTLLIPHGVLALVEAVKSQRWIDMVWGLTEGWWHFEDNDIRQHSPLLNLETWEQVFRRQGLQRVHAYPQQAPERSSSDYALIIGQRDPQECRADAASRQQSSDPDKEAQLRSRIRAVQQICESGAEVLIINADVADEEQMASGLAQACQRFGRLDGVIHAAGVTTSHIIFNLIKDASLQNVESLFRARIYGTRVLETLFRDKPLDFCLLISSNASPLGGIGFCAYSAACLGMDAFAVRRNQTGSVPWISATWDSWPTEEFFGQESRVHTSMDRYAMTRQEAEIAFERVVSRGKGQIVVSAGDLFARLNLWTGESLRLRPGNDFRQIQGVVGEFAESRSPKGVEGRSLSRAEDHSVSEVKDRSLSEVEGALLELWQDILGIQGIGIHDNFFDLQGDSLLGVQLISRINKTFQVKLPLPALFESPTVVELAERIEQLRASAEASDAPEIAPITPIPDQEHYALSHGQRRIWVLSQREGGSMAYNLGYNLMLEGELNLSAFEEAFQRIIRQHESLRTTFVMIAGELRQKVHRDIAFRVNLIDLRGHPNSEEKARALVREDTLKPFDLEKGPLIRVSLLRLTETRYVLLFMLHHIIADGWSLSLLTRQFSRLYSVLCQGEPAALPELRLQYRDYACWLNRLLESDDIRVHQRYWREKMSGDIPTLELPTDFPRPEQQTFNGASVFMTLPVKRLEQIRRFNSQQGVSLFMTLVAAVKILLYRYSGQEDIIVGSPIAGRVHADLEDQFGLYLNTLALRDQLQPETSGAAFLQQVKHTITEAFEHQIYPFDRLIDELDLPRDFSRSPLFDVMVNLQLKEEAFTLEMASLQVVDTFVEDTFIALYDLNFMFGESKNGLSMEIQYNTGLFTHNRVQRIAKEFLFLLERLIAEPEQSLRDVCALLATSEEAQEQADFLQSTMALSEDF